MPLATKRTNRAGRHNARGLDTNEQMEHTPDDEPRQGSGPDTRRLARSMDKPPRRAPDRRVSWRHTRTRRQIKDATLSVVPPKMRRTGEPHPRADRAAAAPHGTLPRPSRALTAAPGGAERPSTQWVKIRRVGNNMNEVTFEATDCGLQRIERYLRDARVGTNPDLLCEDRSRAERADREGHRQGGVDKWNQVKDDGTAG